MRFRLRLPWRVTVLLLLAAILPPRPSSARDETAPAVEEEQTFIEYQLRANEDPSRVARMFHISLDDLLALNHISDPHRLTIGTTLKIPDPRASRVAQLTAEKHKLETQLASAQSSIAALQSGTDQLQSQLAELREAADALRSEQALYRVWRVAVFVAGGAAVVLALALLLAWGKARDAERHAHVLQKEAHIMHTAVDKYRQLSAQFELKYQGLFHQVGLPAAVQHRAQGLRAAYDDDRARLDAIVAEAEHEITRTLAELSPKRETPQAEARLTPLPATRKSG